MIDYRRDDFTRTSQPYDLILDFAAHRQSAYRRALAHGGTYRCVVGRCPRCCACLPSADWLGTHRTRPGPAVRRAAHFEPLAALCTTGDIQIHIDRTFALDEVPAALAHVGEGRASGKVVVVLS